MRASAAPTLLVGAAGADFPIVAANSAFAALAGCSPDLLPGCDLAKLEPLARDVVVLTGLGAARNGRVPVALETALVRPDGSRTGVTLAAHPLQDRGGRVHYLLCSLAARPETGAAAAECGGAASGELVAEARRVGHEFNNLLTIIRGSLDPLRRAPADPLTTRRLSRIAAAVDGLTELVGGFLAPLRRNGQTSATGAVPQRKLPQAHAAEMILLIEPDETFRAQGSAMLRALGYRIDAVADAETALRRLSAVERVDLMLVDRQVRCADGITLAEKARETGRELRVLFSTEAQKLQGENGGAIAKPFQLLALATAVRTAIDGGNRAG